jgi:hypothetical protein
MKVEAQTEIEIGVRPLAYSKDALHMEPYNKTPKKSD